MSEGEKNVTSRKEKENLIIMSAKGMPAIIPRGRVKFSKGGGRNTSIKQKQEILVLTNLFQNNKKKNKKMATLTGSGLGSLS